MVVERHRRAGLLGVDRSGSPTVILRLNCLAKISTLSPLFVVRVPSRLFKTGILMFFLIFCFLITVHHYLLFTSLFVNLRFKYLFKVTMDYLVVVLKFSQARLCRLVFLCVGWHLAGPGFVLNIRRQGASVSKPRLVLWIDSISLVSNIS